MVRGKRKSGAALVASTWRTEAPRANVELLVRERLLRRMIERFTSRLTVLRAGAGFGKSTLLAQAMQENHLSGLGDDRFWRCAPGDASAAALGVALCTLLDVRV